MNKDEKLEKVSADFLKLNNEQQDYVLGIMQALVFAKSTSDCSNNEQQQSGKKAGKI